MKELQAIVGHLNHGASGCVLATLVAAEGSSYRKPGARMLIAEDGARLGSISGGCLEEDLAERAKRVSASGRPELAVYDTAADNDLVWGVGQGCHGLVRVLLEPVPVRPPWAATVDENFRAGRPTELAVVWEGPGAAQGTVLCDARAAARLAGATGVFHETVEPTTLPGG